MSQQILATSRLRKGFLVVGIVLLSLGFFFLYVASVNGIDRVTTFHDAVDLDSAGSPHNFTDPIGLAIEYPINPYTVTMQPNDYLNTSLPNDIYQIEPIYIVFWDNVSNEVLKYSQPLGDMLGFRNEGSSQMTVQVYLVCKNTSNTHDDSTHVGFTYSDELTNIYPVTTTLNHYERPQWFYLCIGMVLSSLAVIPIFKSIKQPQATPFCSKENAIETQVPSKISETP